MKFIFCHGFGFDKNFWQPLKPYFKSYNCHFIEVGYFGQSSLPVDLQDSFIGIGHSLGLTKVLQKCSNLKAFIGLNSFANFLGYNEALRSMRQKELKALRLAMKRSPISALTQFYQNCGYKGSKPFSQKTDINLNLLIEDLEALEQKIILPDLPSLMLQSKNDVIVPPELVDDNAKIWPNTKWELWDNGKHSLGYNQAEKVYHKIMSFLNDINP